MNKPEKDLLEVVTALQAQVAALQSQVARLEVVRPPVPERVTSTSFSRRRLLKGLTLGGLVAGLAGLPTATQARTQVAANPVVIIQPAGKTIANRNQMPAFSYGLVVGVSDLDFSPDHDLADNDTAITGISNGTGGVGIVGAAAAVGVFGSSETGIGLEGVSSTGNGVFASSIGGVALQANSGSGFGVYGYSSQTYGVVAGSTNGAPMRILPNASDPTSANAADTGALWVNSTGDLYVFNGSSGVWRKVQYAP